MTDIDTALIRAALDMAADMIEESAKDAMDAADTSDIGSIIATWLNDEADAIRDIDPAEVLAKVGRAGGWQPIETAPKDGTIVDVWLGDADESDRNFYCTGKTRRSRADRGGRVMRSLYDIKLWWKRLWSTKRHECCGGFCGGVQCPRRADRIEAS